MECSHRGVRLERATTHLQPTLERHIVRVADTGSDNRRDGTMEPGLAGTTKCTMQLTGSRDKEESRFTHHWTIELVICIVQQPAWLPSNDVLGPLQIALLDCIAESR